MNDQMKRGDRGNGKAAYAREGAGPPLSRR